MSHTALDIRKKSFASTLRVDNWWMEPALVVFGFTAFVVYSTWAAFQAEFYWFSAGQDGFGGYLSPMYSPLLFINEAAQGAAPMAHAWFGSWPAWWPAFLPASPAFLIVGFPLAFRFTCYYYRKAYYRAFAGTPPACAVGAIPQQPYKGETGLMIFQNLHRYALYFALIFIVILTYDAILSWFRGGQFGVGVGTIILTINPVLIGLYTFGCHSFRHLIGGGRDCYSCSAGAKASHEAWKKVSWLNARHQLFAWCSLIWVGFTDVYVRMVSMGAWTDVSTWGN
jgi:hypothetical protein